MDRPETSLWRRGVVEAVTVSLRLPSATYLTGLVSCLFAKHPSCNDQQSSVHHLCFYSHPSPLCWWGAVIAELVAN
ncbi:hypothetical protein CPB86DRAFT_196493 [Serendipita vermifera]|nr:hypothetical protein CPB86DRAFT_196493 [Serendipita vermifera]